MVLIIIAVNIPKKGYLLPGSFQAYSHGVVALAVTVAFCFFEPPTIDGEKKYQWSWLKKKYVLWPIIGTSIFMNLATIALPLKSKVPDFSVDGWVYATTCFVAVAISVVYYFALFPVERYDGSPSWSLLRMVGVSWEIAPVNKTPAIYNERWDEFKKSTRYFEEAVNRLGYEEEQERQFGSRQMVYYNLDTESINGMTQNPGIFRKSVFWFFGGSFADKEYSSPWKELRLWKQHRFQGMEIKNLLKRNDFEATAGTGMQQI